MSSIEAALAAIELLKPGEKLVYTQIAAEYKVDRRTLAQRHQGASSSRELNGQNRRALHPHQEQELLRYVERLTRQGLSPSRPMIRRFASQIAKRELGIHWVDKYIKRYDVNLISKWTTGIDRSRHQADSVVKYTLYFDLLRNKIGQYNMDENGYQVNLI
ncbi:hypothetical protein CC86DRAFT_241183, partial [Ophiobolus disseminans]